MKKTSTLAILTLGCLQILGGCDRPNAVPAGGAAHSQNGDHAASEGDEHAHASVGPHGGVLIELGNEEYHAELTHTSDTVTVTVLDRNATLAVPVDAEHVTINLIDNGQPQQVKLMASPEAAETSNKSSRFVATSADLVKQLKSDKSSPKLTVTIEGTAYRGEIHHDHHSHDHDAH